MKKVLSICMVALMMLTMLTACGKKVDEGMVGTWTCEMDFGSYLNEGFASEPEVAEYLYIDEFILEIELTLNSDGTYKMTADTRANQLSFEAVKDDLADGMEEYLTDIATANSMTLDEALAAMETTVEELVDASFTQEMYEDIIGEMEAEGKYEAADGKLYMSDGLNYDVDKSYYETYTLSGNTLTITGDSDGANSGMYPMVFKK